ncbi:MAG: hypothetical protein ACRECO_13890 [Xanthobacteraceae bacterium]
MGTGALPVDRLRQYLRELPPGARVLLITELERALLRGEDIPGGDMVLHEVRTAVREAGQRVPRIGNPARLFFRPVEPFLTDSVASRRLEGRIARSALEPVWAWISRDLMAGDAAVYGDGLNRALAANDSDTANSLVHGFQEKAAAGIEAALDVVCADEKARRRLIGQIGTSHALDDVRTIAMVLASRDPLMLIEDRLPGHIRNFTDGQIDTAKALLDSPLMAKHGLLHCGLILVMRRLASPWQLIRLAVKAAESDEASRMANTPYAAAVTITLGEIERMVDDLKADLERGVTVSVAVPLKGIHDAARGLRTELDLSGDSPWARRLAAIRSEVSRTLKTTIESVPGRVRRLLRPRPSNEITRGAALDAAEVAETEATIEFVGACRNYASELAINEITLRIYQEMQQYLDTGTQSLLDALRFAGDNDRAFRKSQVDAAVRFCAKVFGRDYASLLTKAAEMAACADRKTAAKV